VLTTTTRTPQLETVAERSTTLSPWRALVLPFAFTAALVAMTGLPSIRQNSTLVWSFWGTAASLAAWNALLLAAARSNRTRYTLSIVLRKQHYLQACAQGSVLLYWGWYWRQVYDSAALIVAQLLFAYAFDILLSWSRRTSYTLGFGPFPVIFSINLFLWFKPDWFYLQFLMVGVGFAAKELITWQKDGRRTHIFNPSSFPLGVFSIGLILFDASSITWGPEIADTQFLPPNIYLFLFLIGLPGQFLFGVTTMTMSAVVTMYLFGLLYFAATGTYFFFGYIPIAVFLGMHLLFTDPSTSPRTELGRIIFGMLYALSVLAFYVVLDSTRTPSFYDKLLPVPFLNLMIQAIDRAARSRTLARFDPARLGKSLTGRRRNLAYMTIWTAVFVVMSAAQGVGDTHRARWVPFWQGACREGLRNGCEKLALMDATYCRQGSGYACNDLGLLLAQGRYGNPAVAGTTFQRACNLGFGPGCANAQAVAAGAGTLQAGTPGLADYPIILREGKGPLKDRTPQALQERACRQGWMSACSAAGRAGPAGTP
jgi:hypothetical protein